jgi:hypothetical protein
MADNRAPQQSEISQASATMQPNGVYAEPESVDANGSVRVQADAKHSGGAAATTTVGVSVGSDSDEYGKASYRSGTGGIGHAAGAKAKKRRNVVLGVGACLVGVVAIGAIAYSFGKNSNEEAEEAVSADEQLDPQAQYERGRMYEPALFTRSPPTCIVRKEIHANHKLIQNPTLAHD